MYIKNMFKAVVAIVIALAFVLPGSAAFTDARTIEILSITDKVAVEMKNIAESTTDDVEQKNIDSLFLTRGIVYVDDDADPDWYDATHVKTIQEGVNNATAGDTVYVYNGTYPERVVVNKQVYLVGEHRDSVIVNGGGTGNVFYITTPVTGVNISGFSITNGNYGIYVFISSGNCIMNCNIYSNKDRGIYFRQTLTSSILDCDFSNNAQYAISIRDASYNNIVNNCNSDNDRRGILIQSSFNTVMNYNVINAISTGIGISLYPQISNCTIINCSVSGGRGITLDYADNCSIINTTVDNVAVDGIYINTAKYNLIQNCAVYNSARKGMYLHRSSYNDIINCTFAYNNEHGIHFYEATYNNIDNCDTYNNTNNGIYINLYSNKNNIVNSNAYKNMHNGVFIDKFSNDNNFMNFNAYNNALYGFSMLESINNKLRNTMIYDNVYTFSVDGTDVSHFYHDIDPSNIINGKPIYYLVGQSNLQLDETHNIGFLGLISCNNITASNSDLYGLIIIATVHSTILNVDVHTSGKGVFIWQSSYNNIIDCTSYENEYGFYFFQSSNNNITNCSIYNNSYYGIYIYNSLNCKLEDNTIHDNIHNFFVDGTDVSHFYHDIDPSNIINGKPIYYLVGQSNLQLDETHNIGFLGLISCNNITASNSDVLGMWLINTTDSDISNVSSHNNMYGILISYSSNNNIINCIATENGNPFTGQGYGIYIRESTNNNIINCTAAYNQKHNVLVVWSSYIDFINCNVYNSSGSFSFWVDQVSHCNLINCNFNDSVIALYFAVSSHSNITNCTFYDNGIGMSIEVCSYINVVDCILYNHGMGIDVVVECFNVNVVNCVTSFNSDCGIEVSWWSYDVTVINCTVYSSAQGIRIGAASGVEVAYCTLYNNDYGVYVDTEDEGGDNLFHHNNVFNNIQNVYCDNSNNQWDNGSKGNYWSDYTGIDADGDGIGDTPYVINTNNQDDYPLMVPVNNPPPVITDVVATPAVQSTTEPINITCTVIDNWDMVGTVKIYITGPDGFTLNATMNANDNSYWYEDTYTSLGAYFYHIWANDTYGSEGISDTYSFIITEFDKPISSVNPLPVWRKTVPFTITATAYDNTGVANVTLWYRYSSYGTSWTEWTSYGTDAAAPWSWSFTGIDGYYQFYSIAVDDYGNVENPKVVADASTGIDTVKPVTAIELSGAIGENNWYTSSVIVSLSATDTLSGVESTWYQIGTGYWTFYSVPFTISVGGQHTVSYYSFDQAGNIENPQTEIIKIDTVAPTTTYTLDGLIGSEGWYVSDVTVTLSASDVASGVNYTKYKLNEGLWIDYTEPFDVTEAGEYTMYYYSVDLAGNTETTNEVAFKIEHDVVPPVTTHEFEGILGDNGWFVSSITVILSAVDDSAGVDFTKYKLDDGDWTMYTGPFLVHDDSEHALSYYSVDKLGNMEPVQTVTLKIDQTNPTINLVVEKTGLLKWVLTAEVNDETSGVAKVEFYLNGEYLGEVTAAPFEWEVSKKGTAQAIVSDNAGNEQLSNAVPVSVDLKSQSQGQSIPSTQTQTISSLIQQLFNLY